MRRSPTACRSRQPSGPLLRNRCAIATGQRWTAALPGPVFGLVQRLRFSSRLIELGARCRLRAITRSVQPCSRLNRISVRSSQLKCLYFVPMATHYLQISVALRIWVRQAKNRQARIGKKLRGALHRLGLAFCNEHPKKVDFGLQTRPQLFPRTLFVSALLGACI